jgi:hypothetical protein
VKKLNERFGLTRVAVVGDCGMIIKARIKTTCGPRNSTGSARCAARRSRPSWLRARSSPPCSTKTDMAEMTSPDYPGERLIACYNPFLAAERAR